MDAELLLALIAIFVLLLIAAVFAAAETALTAASPARMYSAEKDGNWRAALVNRIVADKERLIGGLMFGNNVVNITASSLAAGTLVHMFGDTGVLIASGAMTVLIVIFAEVLPKTYAFYNADRVSMFIAPLMNVILAIFAPITKIIGKICSATLRLFGANMNSEEDGSHLEVLRGVIDMHQGPEEETQKQRVMLRSILDLADVTVDEIMIHRRSVLMLDINEPMSKLVNEIVKCPYSRIPLYRDSTEHIVGVLHAKWLMRELQAAGGDWDKINLESITAEPWFIPDTTNLYDQLQAFRDRGEHFAFIVDEYGAFEGIVTLEDILEEIVGEISDEHDQRMPGVRRQMNGTFLVNGNVTIRDLRREFEWELPDEDYTTVAGLLLHETRRLPDVGQSFVFYGFRFDVVRRHRNQVTLIRVTPPKEKMLEDAEATAV